MQLILSGLLTGTAVIARSAWQWIPSPRIHLGSGKELERMARHRPEGEVALVVVVLEEVEAECLEGILTWARVGL